ncbi:MAG: hypothetical protein ACMXYM_03455 [Candidatus Woesearchaeota archaeon]
MMGHGAVYFIQDSPTTYGDRVRSAQRLLRGMSDVTAEHALTDSEVLPIPHRPNDWKRAVGALFDDVRRGSRELHGLFRTIERTNHGYTALIPALNHYPNEELVWRYAQLHASQGEGIDLRHSDLDTHRMRGTPPQSNDLDLMVMLTYAAHYPERLRPERSQAIAEYATLNGIAVRDTTPRSIGRIARELAIEHYATQMDHSLLEPLAFKRACRAGHRSGGFVIGRAQLTSENTRPVRSLLSENNAPHVFI